MFNAGRGAALDERGFVAPRRVGDARRRPRGGRRGRAAGHPQPGRRGARHARRGPPRDARRRVRRPSSPATRGWTPRPRPGSAPRSAAARTSAATTRGAAPSAPSRATRRGGVAAATSTGGSSGKHPGRVGDSPLVAAGTWADDATAAISCTGDGEAIIRDRARARDRRADAPRRASRSRRRASARSPGLATVSAPAGLIAVGADGGVATPFTTPAMPRGWRVGDGPIEVAYRWLTSTTSTPSRSRSSRPARDAAAQEIRKAGDRETAASVAKLPKPTPGGLDREPGRARAAGPDRGAAGGRRSPARGPGGRGRRRRRRAACVTRPAERRPSTPS